MNSVFLLSLIVGLVLGATALWFVVQRTLLLSRFNIKRDRAQVIATAFTAVVVSLAAVSIWWSTSGHEKFLAPNSESSENSETSAESATGSAANLSASNGPESTPAHSGDLNALLVRLEARMQREPNDAEGWALLARTHMELKHYPEAASGYAKAIIMLPKETSLYIEFVDAEVMANNRQWTKAATDALANALRLEPTQPKALWLAGTARFDKKDYAGAVKHWELLAKNTAPDSEYGREIAPSLLEARALRDGRDPAAELANSKIATPAIAPASAGLNMISTINTSNQPLNAALSVSPRTERGNAHEMDGLALALREKLAGIDNNKSSAVIAAPVSAVASGIVASSIASSAKSNSKHVSGQIKLASTLATAVAPDDIVFVFARSDDPQLSRLPLAVAKYRVADLPVRFNLSDNDSMSPEAKLSSAARVIVTARISKSGGAQAKPGDLEGASPIVVLGTSDITILINRKR